MTKAFAISMALLGAGTACVPVPEASAPARLAVADVLGGAADAGFERALDPRPFEFPADYGPHPRFAAEWWYFTGNLATARGDEYGYQLTFFRTSLAPEPVAGATSPWSTTQAWMAHFAVTDAAGSRFYAFERFQRGALDLAGATSSPWRVWLDDWSLEQTGDDAFPLRLRAGEGLLSHGDAGTRISVDLTVNPTKPIVLQGDSGLSQKGSAPGNASYYYSLPRLRTEGVIRVGDKEERVSGESWLDREWSSSALESGQVGWDWFALQLQDGTDLMFYRLRGADGSTAPQSAGALVFDDGRYIILDRTDVTLYETDTWTSPLDGTRYPSAWVLAIPGRGIELNIEPILADQELDLAFRYWEGAVRVRGAGLEGLPVSGSGYVELTGYAGSRPQNRSGVAAPAIQREPE